MCLSSDVATSWSLTQEVAGSSPFNGKYFWTLNSLNVNENIYEKLHCTTKTVIFQVYEMYRRKPIRREITHTLQLSHAEYRSLNAH